MQKVDFRLKTSLLLLLIMLHDKTSKVSYRSLGNGLPHANLVVTLFLFTLSPSSFSHSNFFLFCSLILRWQWVGLSKLWTPEILQWNLYQADTFGTFPSVLLIEGVRLMEVYKNCAIIFINRLQYIFQGSNPILLLSIQSGVRLIEVFNNTEKLAKYDLS